VTQLADVQQFIELSQKTESPLDLKLLLDAITREMKFDHFALLHHVDTDLLSSNINYVRSGHLVALVTYPDQWVETYLQRKIVENDPVLIASERSTVGFSWSDVPKMIDYTAEHDKITAETRKAGLLNGFTVPANVPGETNGSVNFAQSSQDELPAENLVMAQLVGSFAFQAARDIMKRLCGPPKKQPARLSTRQLECLCLVARGKTDWEIAQILGISQETVKDHIEIARNKYGVAKRVQAVMRAVYDGQLTIKDVLS